MPDYQSSVRFTFEADGRVLRKPVGTGWARLDGARFQHPVPPITLSQMLACVRGSRGHYRLPFRTGAQEDRCTFLWTAPASKPRAKGSGTPTSMAVRNAASGARYTFTARQANVHSPRGGIDEQTLEIRAVEVTSSGIGDAPILADLLNQIPPDQEISSVTADGAYDTRKCHDAIAARNAHAVIAPRKNAKLWKSDTAGAKVRNEAIRSSKYLGRALWRQLTGYHRRSCVETTSGLCTRPQTTTFCAVCSPTPNTRL
mgnify:FL=1